MNVATPRRIVLAIGSANIGGAEGQLVRLACHLTERGHVVRVLFLVAGGPLTQVLDDSGVEWAIARPTNVPTSTGRNVAILPRTAALLRRWRPDVIYAWLPGAIWPVFLASFAMPLARVAAFRGVVLPTRFGIAPRLFRRAVKVADAVTVNAPHLATYAASWGARPDRISFVPNGVEIPAWASDPSLKPPTAVVVANFRWYKGHDVLVQALARVTAPLEVRLVGEGSEREKVRQALSDLRVGHRVVFVDHPADVSAELKAAQFAIHPSRTEGLSNAILEEMAAGLGIVATEVGGNGVLVLDGVNGLLVPVGEAPALAEAIERMALDVQFRQNLGMASRKRVYDFSWDECVRRTENVLEAAILRRGRRR